MALPEAQFEALDERTLTMVVSRALNIPIIKLIEWHVTSIHDDYNPLTLGVYRIAGSAQVVEHVVAWSVVLKIVQGSDRIPSFNSDWLNDPNHLLFWQREALVFQSGLLNGLQTNLVPVRCYAVLEPAADLRWLWLEDLQESPVPWSLARHILSARHVGEFNGLFMHRDLLKNYPWLTQHFLRQWLACCRVWRSDAILRDPSVWAAPTIQGILPSDLAPRILLVMGDAEHVLGALEQLPATLSHLDSDRRNLFSRTDSSGLEKTVAIDWGNLGMAAVGEDLGNQVGGNLFHLALPAAEAAQYVRAAFEAYLDGLNAMGWSGKLEHVRFAYVAHQLHYLGFVPIIVETLAQGELPPWMGKWVVQHEVAPAEAIKQWGDALIVLLDQAEEARQYVKR
jgi:hypothetical protein